MLDSDFFITDQLIFFYSAILLIIIALFTFHYKSPKLSVIILILGSFLLGLFFASLDPFLNYWDEQIHALVAKNMIENPLKPTLYLNPILEYNYETWDRNHIWLHKQPLFLWQIALSIKIFGTNVFAVRLPSIIMHSIIVFFIYRIGSITVSKKTGFYAGFLFCFSYYLLDLIVGGKICDHNDIAFIFYVSASFWAWFEYTKNNSLKYVIFIGIFAGCAVLNKWLSGLIVFGGWGIVLLTNKENILKLKNYFHIIVSLTIAIIVFLPWQLYILRKFPIESRYEYAYNSRHFFETLEGHKGSWNYHFKALEFLYFENNITPYIIIILLLFLFFKLDKKSHKIMIFLSIIISYTIFTIAKTKLESFGLIVSVFIFIAFANVISEFELFFNKKTNKNISFYLTLLLLISFCYFTLNTNKIEVEHSLKYPEKSWYRKFRFTEMQFIKALPEIVENKDVILFNVQELSFPSIMFFTNFENVYDFIPSEEELKKLRKQNISFVIFKKYDKNIPEYVYKMKAKIIEHNY